MRRLQAYTNWKYEYVYGEYGDLYNMLLSGDIDILTGLAYKESRTPYILYPEYAMGDTPYTLLKREDDDSLTPKASTLGGKKIGVLSGAMESIIEKYLKDNSIIAEIVKFDDIQDRDAALINKEVDLTLVEGDGTGAISGVEALVEVGESEYYVCVSKKRTDIFDDLNEAQSLLFKASPGIKKEIEATWFRENVVTTTLSSEEKQWIKNHNEVIVGYYDDFLPFSDKDENGEPNGIMIDIIQEMFSNLGINSIDVVYKNYDSYEKMHDGLTGTLNRTAYSRISKLLENNQEKLALMIIDIDLFKHVNDKYGHDVGDKVLKKVAHALLHNFRSKDEVFRYGGDEFVVIFSDFGDGFEDKIIEKISIINQELGQIKDGLPAVSLSAGFTIFSTGFNEDVFKEADNALYNTKKNGRAGCTMYSEKL